ncbi:SCO family protein [Jannaschia sp. W003]|uniref:SCO family protein n=1 Tax=Jannaschia sp. W003 TaxID=2867012 RepID=UPI0021A618F9|nr:SCO family protein [Jannaschia sp. W003]UWQ20622.1 SCO family protein [Jannaschia sp. W003]
MASRAVTLAVGAAVAALALGAGVALRQAVGPTDPSSVAGAELGAPFTLVDHRGAPITEAAFQGQPSLLFFGFTHCPEICPTTVYDIETWLSDLGADDVRAFFVSVDPERDTPEALADYLEPQSDRVTGISGPPEAVFDMARSWRVYWNRRPLGEGDYTVDHYTGVFVLDDEGRLADLIGYGEDPESAKRKIAGVL